MNKFQLFFSLLFVTLLAVSCDSTNDASEYGKEFHEYFKVKDYDGMANMISEKGLSANPKEDWIGVFEGVNEQFGDLKSYTKTGFNTSINDGITKVTLNYTIKFESETLYEQIEFIKEGEEYKIQFYEFNIDKSELSE